MANSILTSNRQDAEVYCYGAYKLRKANLTGLMNYYGSLEMEGSDNGSIYSIASSGDDETIAGYGWTGSETFEIILNDGTNNYNLFGYGIVAQGE